MPRLFDEQDPPPKPKKADSKASRPMSVGSLLTQIKSAVNTHLPGKVRVVGEISNLSDRNHWFFSLKDGDAVVRCVAIL